MAGQLPKGSAEAFARAWDEATEAHRKRFKFKLRPYEPIPGKGPIEISTAFENKDIYNILMMPKVGKRLGIGEALFKMSDEGYENGELVRFITPATHDIVQWAQSRGYYIEPDEGELEIADEGCAAA